MKTNEIFSAKRFIMLCKQNLIYNYKPVIMSVTGYCGGIFILLLIIQAGGDFRTLDEKSVFTIFLFTSLILAVIFAGTGFPSFRTKEKMQNYLTNPASLPEKYLFELLYRIVCFAVIIPLLYMAIYYIEGYFIHSIYNDYEVTAFTYVEIRKVFQFPESSWQNTFFFVFAALVFIGPLTGAAVFTKFPLVKTLFSLAVIIFFNVFLIYFFMEILNYQRYNPPDNALIVSLFKGPDKAFRTMSIGGIIACFVLLMVAYFKLREKEV